jgi:superfamily II RNA helicase
MVKICKDEYKNDKYNEYFDWYSFPLSDFQKYSIQGMIEGNHVLITAHTGSGKTLPAEFAIKYFHNKGKKVIYTSPIKALSNQKFYEFTKAFPEISFGILTGDVKYNPEADVLIMTTEILQNTLYQRESNNAGEKNMNLHFDMDIDNELACVIFDEIHYINDADRGKVWEESILMLPQHVQMLMLSATIDRPEVFAKWCQDRYRNKEVILAPTYHRVVPLTHYVFTTTTKSIYKHEKDKQLQNEVRNFVNQLHVIKDKNGKFHDDNYVKTKKMISLFNKHKVYMTPGLVLNTMIKYLYENDMLPALCFVLSRKNVEKFADQITTNLFEKDSKIPSIIKRECMNILRKLPNFEEYTFLPEFEFIIKLLEKGVAIHHSGLMPIFREMIEMLFSKGFIKVLFATETFSVGINMPTKTVVFTGLSKFDGTQNRAFMSHEYTQMAGRAGRRGIDTVGYVIHATNMFSNHFPVVNDYKNVLSGQPQRLVSKFKISYNLLLSMISMDNMDFENFVNKSMVQNEITKELKHYEDAIETIKKELDNKKNKKYHSDETTVLEYYHLECELDHAKNNRRKKIQNVMSSLEKKHPKLKEDIKHYISIQDTMRELEDMNSSYYNTNTYLRHNIEKMLRLLEEQGFIEKNDEIIKLTLKGTVASHVREVHCLLFAELFMEQVFHNLSIDELVGLLSCFTNIRVSDEVKTQKCNTENFKLNECAMKIPEYLNKYNDREVKENIDCNTNSDEIQYDIVMEAMKWCQADDEISCKTIIQKLNNQKGVFVGEFVKGILKINNIVGEMQSMCEYIGDIALLDKLSQIPEKTLKFIATNQSLYI